MGKLLSLFVDDMAIGGQDDDLPGDLLAAFLERPLDRLLQPAAAGHLHAHHRYASDRILADDFGQLPGIVHAVQLGAADQGDAPLDKALMEARIGVGRAIGGDQQLGAIKIGRVDRGQLCLLYTSRCV